MGFAWGGGLMNINSKVFAAVFVLASSGITTGVKALEVTSGVYTEAQAADAAPVYARQCASCHGDRLGGGADSPPLTGFPFVSFWSGKTLDELATKIHTMPPTRPGGLTERQYTELLALILKANGYPAGTTSLPAQADQLKAIAVVPPAGMTAPPSAASFATAHTTPPPENASSTEIPALLRNYTPVTSQMLASPPPADWLQWRGTYGGWGYSKLDQINKTNVANLEMVWSWTMDAGRQQTTPLVHDGVMFLQHSCNFVQALDAKTGDLLWEYRREVVKHPSMPMACNNRNPALYGDKLILGTHDAYLVALDVHTGKVAWEQRVGEWKVGHHYSGGPIMAGDKVIAGLSGCYYITPGGCWISAHDVKTGKELWRTYTLAHPGQPGNESWNNLPVEERHGGSAWVAGTFDPDSNTIYYGVAVPIPWSGEQRGTGDGKVLYTNSTIALDAKTGKIKWYFQHMPNDQWDLDHPFLRMIVSTDVTPDAKQVKWIAPNLKPGQTRKVITGIPGKTGLVWTLDAKTGDFLWARETAEQNVVLDIDAKNRTAILNDKVRSKIGETTRVCPGAQGVIAWQTPAYSPKTNTIYAPLNNVCMDFTLNPVKLVTGGHHGSARVAQFIAPSANGNVGSVTAIDVKTGDIKWKIDQRAGLPGSMLATAGGVVFLVDDNRRLRAYDDETGNVLWEQILNSRAGGFPITHEVGGRQYIAIPAGTGITFTNLTPEIKVPDGGNMLYVFALPQAAKPK